jgi:16S rRNA (cytosine1407-C5)-methyltransferase
VNLALQKHPVELEEFSLPIPSNPGFTSFEDRQFSDALALTKRITPWEAGSEGFFIAKFRKTESAPYIPKSAGKLKTTFRVCKKEELKPIVLQISEQFGIAPEVFENYTIVEKSSDYYILAKDWNGGDFISFNKAGLKIGALDKYGNFIIHTNLAQILEKYITKNIITLQNGDEIKKYMDGALLKNISPEVNGQAAVKYKDHIIGTGVVHDGTLKSRFPRAFRTTAITF